MIRQIPSLFALRLLCIVLQCIILAAGFSMISRPASAEAQVEFPANVTMIDLATQGTQVAAQRRNVALEVPGETEGARAVLELRGKGLGPDFNWTIYSIHNQSEDFRSVVLSIGYQRLTASGALPIKPFGTQVVKLNWVKLPEAFAPLPANSEDAFTFLLPAKATITFAVEGPPQLKFISVMDANVFAQKQMSASFLHGATLTGTLVLCFFIIALFGIRSQLEFVAGSFFTLMCLQFMALETGYLDRLAGVLFGIPISLQFIRAISEILLALGVAVAAWTLSAPNQQKQQGSVWRILLGTFILGLAVGLFVLSFRNPLGAAEGARLWVIVSAVSGFCLALRARQTSTGAMDYGILFWSMLLAWVLMAGFMALGQSTLRLWPNLLLSGISGVVAVLAFALARFAFAQGYLSNYYLTDATRRSLALAGAQHYLWDWIPGKNVLEIGDDLAKSLGFDPAVFHAGKAARKFSSLLHPADQPSYVAIANPGYLQGGNVIDQELRLQNAAGEYRWFVLKARALQGSGSYAERLIGTLTDITRGKQNEDRLINEVVRDPVTGLPSRAIFIDRLEREIAKPLALPVRVMLIAIQRFKFLNDGLGHDLGDQLLLAAGQRIADNIKPEETLTRISGSMFAVMFVETMESRAAKLMAERLLEILSEPMTVSTQQVYLTPSIGISLSSADGFSAEELQKQAASALHAAQAEGSRAAKVFDDEMKDERAENVALETDLRRAIDRREIEVHYQPLIHLATGSIAGLEALARWNHPSRGQLSPAEFINMAEEAGLINEIGDLILSEATRQMGIWQRTIIRDRPVYVAVNVSADQFSDSAFYDKLSAVISREGLAAQTLKIELTESVVMRYPERTRQLITRMRSMGVGVACDDFGTGFSNLASLRDLNFDTLKMDKSFITAGALDGRGGLILSTVVELAHSLGMVVVAEGIENAAQLDILQLLGCDLGQGYLLGEPKPARELTNLLARFPAVEAPIRPPRAPNVPEPKEALLAPRKILWPRELFEVKESVTATIIEAEPEELPSIFTVSEKRKQASARKPKSKPPQRKSVKTKPKQAKRKK